MITRLILTTFILFIGGGSMLLANGEKLVPQEREIKNRATHDEIAKRQKPRKAATELKTVRFEDVTRAAHRQERQQKGLISRSSTVSSSSAWTLVPKGAVLHVPPLYAKRVNESRNGKLVGWQEFYGKNRAWIRALPVTIEQASGEDPLSEEFLESLRKSGQLVVAVCKGGPISVKLPEGQGQGQRQQLPEGSLPVPPAQEKVSARSPRGRSEEGPG